MTAPRFSAVLAAATISTALAGVAHAAPPPLDIVGFQPGMTLDAAVAKLKTVAPNIEVKVNSYAIPEFGRAVPWLITGKTPSNDLRLSWEQIAITVTLPPAAPPVVWGVDRSARYADGQQPTMAATLAALRAKYGREMLGYGGKQLYWGWDERGAPYPEAVMRQCANFAGMDHMTRVTDTIYRPNLTNAVQQQCLKGKFIAANIAPANNPDLVGSLDVAFTDAAVETTFMALTRAARAAAQDKAAADQVRQAQQNKPRL